MIHCISSSSELFVGPKQVIEIELRSDPFQTYH